MKLLKKLVCLSLSLMMIISIIKPLTVYGGEANKDVNTYLGKLITYYRDYQDDAKTDILRTLDEIKKIDKMKYTAWKEIMDFWSEVNKKGYTNIGVLPDGLPQDDSLCIVILGFALNSDGTMKQELIDRLQVGLDSAKKYPNAYVVVTGGGTASGNPNVTEGELMGKWLLHQGLSEDRLIIENKAPDTVGNAKNTYKILNKNYPQVKSLAMVTSDYHIPRGSILFFTQCLLSAYEIGSTPLQMVSNAGCYTSSNGYESIDLQANGIASIAGVNLPNKQKLSKLNGLVITQHKKYDGNKKLKLSVKALYDSNYSRDVSELIQISNFNPSMNSNQTITLTYTENGITISTDFNLNETNKAVYDNTYLKQLIAEVESRDFSAYTRESVTKINEALKNAKNILALGNNATKAELDSAYNQMNNALNNLVKLINIAYKMNTKANCNQDNAYKINDGVKNTSNYWASENNGNVASKDAEFIINLDGIYDVENITVYPYWNGQRIYQYELYGSRDKSNWIKIGENLSNDYTTSNGFQHNIDIDEGISYIKLKGVKTSVIGRPDINNIHIVEMEVYGQEKNNLAYLKPVTSSGTDNSASSSQNSKDLQVVDGDRKTYWDAGKYSENPWVTIDLEDVYLLDSLNIITYWERNDRYYYYDIYTSIDGETYVPLYSKTKGAEKSTILGEHIPINSDVYARYIKVVGKFNSANSSFHLNELRVYGSKITMRADYTKVDEIIATVPKDLSKYTEESVKVLQNALNAVERDKKIYEQEIVNEYVKTIETALNTLKYKGANYAKVDEAISKVPNDLNKYTDESVKVLQDALNAVKRNLDITKQTEVDAYAKSINDAITGLKKKSTNKEESKEVIDKSSKLEKENTKNEIKTGDSTNTVLYLSILILSSLLLSEIILYQKRETKK